MALINKENFILRKKRGETLVKKPGSINGYDFVIDSLENCNIFILDHTAQVQVDDCINCKIFIGPVGGSAFFRDCKDCRIEVACQQLRTRDCERLEIGLYCSTKPIIETSTFITFKCWGGAYFGLTQHFKSAGLNPEENDWYNDVYDFNQKEDYDGKMHFEVLKDAQIEFWEVAVYDDDGEPVGVFENPVLLPDGTRYSPKEEKPVTSVEADAESDDEKAEGGDDKESEERAEIQAKAAAYLSAFYKERSRDKKKRISRRSSAAMPDQSKEDSSEENTWARIISLIDFQFCATEGSSGKDMSTFKSALFAAKNRKP